MDVKPNYVIKCGLVDGSKQQTCHQEKENLIWLAESNKNVEFDLTSLKWYFCNVPISSIRQGSKNPTCGLVALSMAINMVRDGDCDDTDDLLSCAINHQLTRKGEMFSAYSLKRLVEVNYEGKTAEVVKFNQRRIMQQLARSKPVLVPYDSDRNHSPCCNGGHSSHWAVLTGVVIGGSGFAPTENAREVCPSVFQLQDGELENMVDAYPSYSQQVWVFAKQGKSSKLLLWRLDDLESSNRNIAERNPNKNWDELHCPFDLRTSLCGLVVELN